MSSVSTRSTVGVVGSRFLTMAPDSVERILNAGAHGGDGLGRHRKHLVSAGDCS
jgi:hypothetical protein